MRKDKDKGAEWDPSQETLHLLHIPFGELSPIQAAAPQAGQLRAHPGSWNSASTWAGELTQRKRGALLYIQRPALPTIVTDNQVRVS